MHACIFCPFRPWNRRVAHSNMVSNPRVWDLTAPSPATRRQTAGEPPLTGERSSTFPFSFPPLPTLVRLHVVWPEPPPCHSSHDQFTLCRAVYHTAPSAAAPPMWPLCRGPTALAASCHGSICAGRCCVLHRLLPSAKAPTVSDLRSPAPATALATGPSFQELLCLAAPVVRQSSSV